MFVCLCWGLTSQSTIFQSCWDGAIASWVINQYFRGVKCLAQGHNTAAVGFEPPTSRSGVRHSTILLMWFLTVTCSCCPYLYFGSPIMWVTYLGSWMTTYLSGKELFIRFTARAFHKLLSIYVFSYLPFGIECRIWNLIVSVPNHCLSFYFSAHMSHERQLNKSLFNGAGRY